MDIAQDFAVNAGFGKSGGDGGVIYGTNTGMDINLGSGEEVLEEEVDLMAWRYWWFWRRNGLFKCANRQFNCYG